MENIYDKAQRVSPHKSPIFWGIILLTSIAIFSIFSLMQRVEGFSEGLKNSLETYQIIFTLASGVIAGLSQWIIAYFTNCPSKLEQHDLVMQHLRREYMDGEQRFVKIFGKKTEDYPFQYISRNDLPVIYSKLYEEENLATKGKVSINKELVDILQHYFHAAESALDGFFQAYNEEAMKPSPNPNLKEGYVFQLFEYLHRNLIYLHQNLGVKFVPLSEASIKTYEAAYFETLHLIDHLGGHFEELRDSIINRDSTEDTNSQEDIQNLFYSADVIAKELMRTSGEATFESFYQGVQVRHILKQAKGSKLYNLALQVLHGIVDDIMESDPNTKIVEEEDTYPSCSIYSEDEKKHITLKYEDIDDSTLLLTLIGADKEIGTVVKFIDEEQTKYMIDRDMGAFFISECKDQIRKVLV